MITTIVFLLFAVASLGMAIGGILWSRENNQSRKWPISLFFFVAAAFIALAANACTQIP